MSEESVDYRLGQLAEGVKNIHSIFERHTKDDATFQKEAMEKLDKIIANNNIAYGKKLGYKKIAAVAGGFGGGVVLLIELLIRVM